VKLLIVAHKKISANTVFVFSVNRNVVNSQMPQIMTYKATAALYPTEVEPSEADEDEE
jgi:hypothetical protein